MGITLSDELCDESLTLGQLLAGGGRSRREQLRYLLALVVVCLLDPM